MRFPLARVLAAVALASACTRELSVPAAPGPSRPGMLQGTPVYAEARTSPQTPEYKATVEPIVTNVGAMLIRFDADADSVFDHERVVPEGRDNGGFTLDNLPQGTITLAFFRMGYRSAVSHVDLREGEDSAASSGAARPSRRCRCTTTRATRASRSHTA